MLHSYTFKKLGMYYTRINGFNNFILEDMEKSFLRYDANKIAGQAMFVFMNDKDYKKFHDEYNIIEIDQLEEFKLVAKIML